MVFVQRLVEIIHKHQFMQRQEGGSGRQMFRKFFFFSLPIMVMNILQLLFNTADMVVVGRFSGNEALAAVGATGSIINLIINLFMGLSVGTSVVVARDYGAGKMRDVHKAVHTSLLISILAGILVMILGIALCRPLLVMMGTPEDILDLAALYMRIYFISLPASMVFNFAAAILRAVGDSRRPMYFLIITGILHVGFNLMFVLVFHMSVDGVAWATVISQYLAVALILFSLLRHEGAIRFTPKALRVDMAKLKDILRIGLPAGLQSLLFSVSNVMIQSAINSFGSTMVAASSASSNIENYVGTTMNAYYNAAITFTAQSMGAKKYKQIDTIAKISTGLVFATWLFVGGFSVLLSRPLLGIFTTDPNVVALGRQRLLIMMSLYFTCGAMNVFPGVTRGMGYSISPMLTTLVGNCLLRIVWLYTVFAMHPTVFALFSCYPVTWAVAGIGQVCIFFIARRRLRKQVAPV